MPFFIPKNENVLVQIGEGDNNISSPLDIKIFIWNVYKGQRQKQFEKEFKVLAGKSDFLFLQEAVLNKKMPAFFESEFQQYEWHLAQSFHYKKDLSSTGVAIGSRQSPLSLDFIRSKEKEFFWFTPKLTLFSVYEIQGIPTLMVCTHVLNFVTTSAFTQYLYEIAAKISLFSGPVILAGDFNTWNMKRYLIMKNIFKDLHLDHVDLENDGRFLKLDHVFVRGFDVLKGFVHSEISGSDHLPLELSLKIRLP